jgi:diguanylate cyclase (GGDEF)-like protein
MKDALIDAVAAATAHRDRDDLDRAVGQLLFDQVQPSVVRIYRIVRDHDVDRVQLRVVADATGVREQTPTIDLGSLPRLADRVHWMECALLNDVVHFVPDDEAASDEDRFDSVFPIVSSRGLTGLVELEYSGDRGAIRPYDAGVVHGILRIMRNHLSTLDYAERDTLTGLLNRRTFESAFAKRLRHGVQGSNLNDDPLGRGTWLLTIDVDRFKSINDNYGHLFGDEVLLLVGRILSESFRSSETIYRFGGEEFVVLLEGADETGAGIAANRLRERLAAHRFPQIGQVTASVGYTRVTAADIPTSAIERADIALYYCKSHGRNCCFCYESLLRDGLVEAKHASTAELELF